MQISLPIWASATAFVLVSCSTGPKYAPDPSLTRTKANESYKAMDSEMAETASTAPASPATELPSIPTIMVVPPKDDPMYKAMAEAVNSYLTQKRFEVKSLEGNSQLDDVIRMQNDIANAEDDMSYLASLALGADIYLKFSGAVDPDHITVELSAYESSTARLLGSETIQDSECDGNDQAALKACLHDAARRGMPLLEKKILAYWKQDLSQGYQYKIVMNLKGEFDEEQIEDLHDDIVSGLKQNFKRVNVNVMTAKTIDVIVYADAAEFSDSQSIYSFIRNTLKGKATTKKINITKKFILMDVE